MMTSAPRTSTPASCKPMRMPSSQATPATPPPPRTSARVLVSFDFIKVLLENSMYQSHGLPPSLVSICLLHDLQPNRNLAGAQYYIILPLKCQCSYSPLVSKS